MIKLVVTDMDGTLLNSQSQLPENFERYYRALQAKGVRLVIASGRPYQSLVDLFSHFDHDIIFVSDNGAYIGLQPQPVVISSFNIADMATLIKQGRQNPQVDFLVCSTKGSYVDSKDDALINLLASYKVKVERVDDLLALEGDILKVTACHQVDWANEDGSLFELVNNNQFSMAQSSKYWVDIMAKTNKGEAVQYLQQHFNIAPSQTMAFGDYCNDIEMLQQANYSYAMANAHQQVKNVANYAAPSNDDAGVIKVIEQVVLQQG